MKDDGVKNERKIDMSKIHSRDTKPEMIVRQHLHSRGFRYRVNVKDLPGKPDIAIKKYKIAIFVNGCLWHGHYGCKLFRIPKSKPEYWINKINRNRERDQRNHEFLKQLGWRVFVIWECQLTPCNKLDVLLALEYAISRAILTKYKKNFPH